MRESKREKPRQYSDNGSYIVGRYKKKCGSIHVVDWLVPAISFATVFKLAVLWATRSFEFWSFTAVAQVIAAKGLLLRTAAPKRPNKAATPQYTVARPARMKRALLLPSP